MIEYNSVVDGINTGDLDLLMTLYDANACFASQAGTSTIYKLEIHLLPIQNHQRY